MTKKEIMKDLRSKGFKRIEKFNERGKTWIVYETKSQRAIIEEFEDGSHEVEFINFEEKQKMKEIERCMSCNCSFEYDSEKNLNECPNCLNNIKIAKKAMTLLSTMNLSLHKQTTLDEMLDVIEDEFIENIA